MGARPASDIQWTVDNDNPDDDETISDNTQDSDLKDTASTMTFTPTYLDHQNTTLTCKATNDATIVNRQPVIKQLLLDVFDVVGPLDVDILQGEDATLQCVITDFSGSIGKWSKVDEADEIFNLLSSGAYIGTGHDSTKHFDWSVDTTGTHHYDLNIPNIDINDEGCYFCGIGTGDSNISPNSVTISEESSGVVIVTSGRMTTLTCVAMEARPASDIQWTVDNDNLDDDEIISDNTQDSDLKDTTSTMTFKPTYLDHQNTTLICKATNDATIAKDQPVTKEITLDVWVSPDSLYFNGYPDSSDVTMISGESFNIMCRTTKAHPAASIQWYIDDDIITSNVNHRILWDISGRKDTVSELSMIPNREDFGKKLKCKSNHDVQNNPKTIFVNIIVQYSAVIFNDTLEESSADQGQNATIVCTSIGYPLPVIEWYKWTDGSRVALMSDTSRVVIKHEPYTMNRTTQSTLYILNARPGVDHGVYTCYASNIIGSDYLNITLAGKSK
uniref:Hemicentin-1-like n=1 Tax=Saccoglossus kowalevskii TaxID=10224 RepID=A0ABM0M0N3_SACKO|nr:PREDICTED: hemicentin-1-like [Saccoglossus kowalevskii]